MSDKKYRLLSADDFDADEARMLHEASKEAQRGYSDRQLAAAAARPVGRPLSVGASRASNVIRVRLDDERDKRIEDYRKKRRITRSEAVRELIDKGLDMMQETQKTSGAEAPEATVPPVGFEPTTHDLKGRCSNR
ncbi:hypothetical protein BEUL_0241 [Bifidobacterium eulemuris]|uniref:Ribbon-helix-helix protein CopG domain-containing protein n=1 Tax=Bifidobacterium eulemuris TaxID=1765219 RepID=A0A261GDK8_9BIFI|nr:hypothetical protein BEUL_0241 [Bifidobacterium eulemuris]